MSIADKLTYLNETKRQLREVINAVFGAGLTESDSFRSYADFLYGLWTPELLFQNGEQGAWYDPSDLTTLFQDAAGTTPVTADGDPVGMMLDLSGNGNHATQSTSAARPIYRTDGVLHWLESDGTDDWLSYPQILAKSVAWQTDNSSTTDVVFGHDSSGANYVASGGDALRYRTNTTDLLTPSSSIEPDYTAACVLSDGNLVGYFDAVQSSNTIPSVSTLDTVAMFRRGTIFSSVDFYGGAMSQESWTPEQVQAVSSYLATLKGRLT